MWWDFRGGKEDVDDMERECEGCLDVVLDFPRGVVIVFDFEFGIDAKLCGTCVTYLRKILQLLYVVQCCCCCCWWLLFANKSFSVFLNQAKRSYESGNYSDGVWIYICG